MPAPPAHTRIPESLRPYIRLPRRDTLTLVTGVLGATTNWIVLRFIGAAAAAATAATTAGDGGSKIERGSSGEDSTDHKQGQDQSQGQTQKQTPTVAVVLVSWMRDMEFWRTEGMKVVGIDIVRLAEQGRFAFVDGLRELFSGSEGSESDRAAKTSNHDDSTATSTTKFSTEILPASVKPSSVSLTTSTRNLPLPNRGSTRSQEEQRSLPINPASQSLAKSTKSNEENSNSSYSLATTSSTTTNRSKQMGTYSLRSPTLPHLEEIVSQAITFIAQQHNNNSNIILILDNPDLFLAATSMSAISLTNTIQKLRSCANIHSTIVTLAADGPLLFPADQHSIQPFTDSSILTAYPSSIQSHHAALVTGLAHHASSILSVRLLDTGFAGDVSGVLRVGVGGGARADGRADRSADKKVSEYHDSADDYDEYDDEEEVESGLTNTGKEMLYFINAGGDVKILT